MKIIIMVWGYKGSGKTTLSDLVVGRLRGGDEVTFAECTSFAQPLKHLVAEAFGTSPVQIDILKRQGGPISINGFPYTKMRGLLQRLAEEMKELLGDSFWADRTVDEIHKRFASLEKGQSGVIVIDDARFLVEKDAVENYAKENKDVRVVHILVEDPHLSSTDAHKSETEFLTLPKETFDVILHNNKTLGIKQLKISTDVLVKDILHDDLELV